MPLRTNFAATGTLFLVLASAAVTGSPNPEFLKRYKGLPFEDSHHRAGAQMIPGRVQCALYDLGGEGVAYHDTTPENEGSGKLNPVDGSYLNEFRMRESVDTSYTKFHGAIDNNPFNFVVPEENQLYVGWTVPGEWFNLTVTVDHPGLYRADLLYTSRHGGTISVDVNGEDSTGPIAIPSTEVAADPIAWRQWHHWNAKKGAMQLKLDAGTNVLTVHIVTEGNMNLAYLNFTEIKEPK